MSTNVDFLRMAGQRYRVSVDVYSPRQWELSDVDFQGYDQATPQFDIGNAEPDIEYWQAIKDISEVRGSVSGGGWATTITVPWEGAGARELADFFACDLMIRTWHGGNPGVVGAAGIDMGRVKLFRGYLRQRTSNDKMHYSEQQYELRSGISFLQDSSLSRGIDWFDGSPSHPGNVSATEMVSHMLNFHTNWFPRSEFSLYLPNQIHENFTMNQGSVYDMIKSIADNEVIEGWVYCGREDQLVISGHPNMVGPEIYGNGASSLLAPIIEFDDTIVQEWTIPTRTRREIASYTVNAVTSDEQSIVKTWYIPGGLGSREVAPITIKSDDPNHVGDLCKKGAFHANREFPSVQLLLPLNIAVNTGDVVLCTHRGKTLRTQWVAKPFVVTDVSYTIGLQKGTFSSVVTVDEIVEELF